MPVETHAGHHLLTRAHLTLRATGMRACTHADTDTRDTQIKKAKIQHEYNSNEKKEDKQTYKMTLGSVGSSVRPIVIFPLLRFNGILKCRGRSPRLCKCTKGSHRE